jgi:hypothetical protein
MEVNGQLHAPAAFLRGNSAGSYWIGGWVGPRTGLDDEGEEKNLTHTGTRTATLLPSGP